MKKLFLFLFSAVLLVSCAKDGDDGAPGPQGPQGEQGPGATDEIVYATFESGDFSYTHFPDEDLSNTKVLVFMEEDLLDDWALLPYTEPYAFGEPVTFSATQNESWVSITARDQDAFLYEFSSITFIDFKFVYIPLTGIKVVDDAAIDAAVERVVRAE